MPVRSQLLTLFPNLVVADCDQTSLIDRGYNCIGFAAGRLVNWWPYPGPPETFWPGSVQQDRTIAAFEAAFGTVGYARCANGDLEDGVEKIAIYVDAGRLVTHAARQFSTGEWRSKLGHLEDIRHPLPQLEGPPNAYGKVSFFMARPRRVAATTAPTGSNPP